MQKIPRQARIQELIPNPDIFPEDYKCAICLGIPLNPIKCQTCTCICCNKCTKTWKTKEDRCPFKCTKKNWKIEPMEPLNVKIDCPNCSTLTFWSAQEFLKHIDFCPNDLEFQKKKKMMNEYICIKGHKLQFFTSDFFMINKTECVECTDSPVRSFCSTCKSFYCVFCRIPPCSKTRCPIGHTYKQSSSNYITICDFCGNICKTQQKVYKDQVCSFKLCLKCFQNQPNYIQNPISSSTTICPNNHQLVSKNFQNSSFVEKCSICQVSRQCNKYCEICQETYCLVCKPLSIINFKCFNNQRHRFKLNNNTNSICLQCKKQQNISYQDGECGLTYCQQCFLKIHAQNDQKGGRKAIQEEKCKNAHNLFYFQNKNNIQKNCHGCNQLKNIRLYCLACEPVQYYCFECKPFSAKNGCLFGHTLYGCSETKECLFCQKKTQGVQCKPCNIFVCMRCCDDGHSKNLSQPAGAIEYGIY